MKDYSCLISLLFFLAGCATQRPVYAPDFTVSKAPPEQFSCNSIFPKGKWQFVHSIDYTRRGERGTTIIGITTLSGDTIQSALVTIEGFTLFEADYFQDMSFRVHRAVPPFDSLGFAEGMMGDISSIFRPPSTNTVQAGFLAEKEVACRYTDSEGKVTDILPNKNDCWQITKYTPTRTLVRSITGQSCKTIGSTLIPEYLELKGYGMTDYTLKMTLLSADKSQ